MGLGDELMAAGHARLMRRHDTRRVRIVGRDGRPRWHSIWDGHPDLARVGERGDFQELRNGPGARPYIAGRVADRWIWRDYQPEPGFVRLDPEHRAFGRAHAGLLVIEPNLKSTASPNKQWGLDRWQALVDAAPGLPWAQLGPPGTRLLRGVRLVETADLRYAAGVLHYAAAYVGPEGGLHHLSASMGNPAVVLFGGYISPAQTGYSWHRNLFTGGAPCGSVVPCAHCAEAMSRITVADVFEALEGLGLGLP